MSWQQVAPGVWVDPDPVDKGEALRLMQERLDARRTARIVGNTSHRWWRR